MSKGVEQMEADVVVMGSGAAGMAAANAAGEGRARVVIVEKLRHHGGTSNFSQGLFAVGSAMQRQRYVGLTPDEAFKTAMEYSHWRANPRLVRAVIDRSADTISWLQKTGGRVCRARDHVLRRPPYLAHSEGRAKSGWQGIGNDQGAPRQGEGKGCTASPCHPGDADICS